MERLTKRIGEHVYYTKGIYEDTIPSECESWDVRNILNRLAEYEDTGLSPEEIIQFMQLLASAVADINNVTKNVAYEGHFCGAECAKIENCEDAWYKGSDHVYRCLGFKWRFADIARKVIVNINPQEPAWKSAMLNTFLKDAEETGGMDRVV